MGVAFNGSNFNLEASIKLLAEQIKALKEDNERLNIENGLLRKASEEQRELNGQLRIEIQQMDDWALGKNRT